MMNTVRRFKFFLVKHKAKKTLIVTAYDSVEARERIRYSFPDWQVSMFWPEWP